MIQKFDIYKSIELIKLVLIKLESNACDFHKLCKIFYFAEQKHLVRYGRSISGDRYVALKDGPVPSNIYDLLKSLRSDSIFKTDEKMTASFSLIDNFTIKLKDTHIELDSIAESELECISESINENQSLSYSELITKSHDSAWQSAGKHSTIHIDMIAKAGGASDDLLNYIKLHTENYFQLKLQ